MREDELKLNEHFRLLYRHRYLIIISFLCVILPVSLLIRKEKPTYKSSVSFAVRNESIAEEVVQSMDVGIDLTIANQLDLLRSQGFLEQVYDALPEWVRQDEVIEKPSLIGRGIQLVKKLAGMSVIELSPRAEGIMDLEKRSSVDHRGGDVIQVSVTSSNPKKAQTIANIYAQQFAEVNLEAMRRKTSALNDFFTEQIEKSYAKLKDVEKALEDFKRTRGIVSIQDQSLALSMRLNSIEDQYVEIKTQRELAERRAKLLNQKLQQIEKDYQGVSELETSLPRIESLKKRLTELEQERMSASAIYTDRHPKIVAIKKDIEETVKELRQITKGDVGTAVQVLDWQNLLVEKVLVEVGVASLRSKEDGYKALLDDYKKRLLYDLPEKERGLFQLLRDVELARQMHSSLLNNHERLHMVAAEKAGNVTILDPARVPVAPLPSRRLLKLMFGIVFGVIVGVGLSYLAELLNLTLRTVEEVERKIKLPVLGTILDMKAMISNKKETGQRIKVVRSTFGVMAQKMPNSLVAENFNTLSANMTFSFNGNDKGKALLVTSPGPGEGKSTVISNLALTMAKNGKSTILIDADLRRPVQHQAFGVPAVDGLSDVLMNGVSLSKVLRPKSNKLALDVMTSGRQTNSPVELVSSKKMNELINMLKSHYDYVLIDAPPILTVADSINLSHKVDGVILVFRSGKTQTEAARRSKEVLSSIKANILGIVLNKLNIRNEYGPYSYYHRYYQDYTEQKTKKRSRRFKSTV